MRSPDSLPSRALSVLLFALVCGGLSACGSAGAENGNAGPSRSPSPHGPPAADHATEAQTLEDRLDALAGVAGVDHTYAKRNENRPGSADFDVVMTPGSPDTDVVRVLGGAFRMSKAGFGDDTVEVDLYRGEDEIRLQVRDAGAQPSEVAGVLRFGLSSRETGERLLADLVVRGGAGAEMASRLEFDLPAGSDRYDVLPRLNRFDGSAVPPHTDIGVRAGDDSALSGFGGLPTARDLRIWKELDRAPFASSFSVDLGPQAAAPGESRAARVLVTLHRDRERSPAGAIRSRVAFMEAHLDTLIRAHLRFQYDVNLGGTAVLSLKSSNCDPGGSTWKGEVRSYYAEHAGVCAD